MTHRKIWPGENCRIIETIDKPTKYIGPDLSVGQSGGHMLFRGASVEGKAHGISALHTTNASLSMSGTGEEVHTFKVELGEGCEVVGCNVSVVCKVDGSIGGVVQDSGTVKARGSILVCGVELSYEFQVNEELPPSQEEIELQLGADIDNIDGRLTWTKKMTVGSSDTFVISPPLRNPDSYSCVEGEIQLRIVHTASVSLFNNDWTGDLVSVRPKINCEIEVRSVNVTCDCGEGAAAGETGTGVSDSETAEVVMEPEEVEELRQQSIALGTLLEVAGRERDKAQRALDELPPMKLESEAIKSLRSRAEANLTTEQTIGYIYSVNELLDEYGDHYKELAETRDLYEFMEAKTMAICAAQTAVSEGFPLPKETMESLGAGLLDAGELSVNWIDVRTSEDTTHLARRPPLTVAAYLETARGLLYVDPVHEEEIAKSLKARIGDDGRWTILMPGAKDDSTVEKLDIIERDPDQTGNIGDWRGLFANECVNTTMPQVDRFYKPDGSVDGDEWKKIVSNSQEGYEGLPPGTFGECKGLKLKACWETYDELYTWDAYSDKECTNRVFEGGKTWGWTCLEI